MAAHNRPARITCHSSIVILILAGGVGGGLVVPPAITQDPEQILGVSWFLACLAVLLRISVLLGPQWPLPTQLTAASVSFPLWNCEAIACSKWPELWVEIWRLSMYTCGSKKWHRQSNWEWACKVPAYAVWHFVLLSPPASLLSLPHCHTATPLAQTPSSLISHM